MTWRISLLGTLRRQLEALSTDPNLQESILRCIDSALADRTIEMTGPFSMALVAQARIGWLAMLHGYWTLEWQVAYDRTYKTPDSKQGKKSSNDSNR
jgi:hypothetical protein